MKAWEMSFQKKTRSSSPEVIRRWRNMGRQHSSANALAAQAAEMQQQQVLQAKAAARVAAAFLLRPKEVSSRQGQASKT
jgi:hypothetical protein